MKKLICLSLFLLTLILPISNQVFAKEQPYTYIEALKQGKELTKKTALLRNAANKGDIHKIVSYYAKVEKETDTFSKKIANLNKEHLSKITVNYISPAKNELYRCKYEVMQFKSLLKIEEYLQANELEKAKKDYLKIAEIKKQAKQIKFKKKLKKLPNIIYEQLNIKENEITEKYVIRIDRIADIEVVEDSDIADLKLPSTVKVTFWNDQKKSMKINWIKDSFYSVNISVPGSYMIYGLIEGIKQKISTNINVVKHDYSWALKSKETNLLLAVKQKNFKLAKYLLENGANPNYENDYIRPLYYVVNSYDLDFINLFIEHDVDLDDYVYFTDQPLTIAIKNNNLALVKTLLEAGANVEKMKLNYEGDSFLSYAMKEGNMEIIKTLLDYGAAPFKSFGVGANSWNFNNPYELAESLHQQEIINYINSWQWSKKPNIPEVNIKDVQLFTPLDIQKFLNKNFSKINTSVGITNVSFNVLKADILGQDYWVQVNYDVFFFHDVGTVLPNKYYDEKIRQQVRNELKYHQENLGLVLANLLPNKELMGGYYYSYYRYPNLKVDLESSYYFSWKINNGDFHWDSSIDDNL